MKSINIESSWKNALSAEFEKEYLMQLRVETEADYLLNEPPIYPPASLIFNAFNLTPLPTVKVVILGQDPYHGPGQAHGLAFSVQQGMSLPPSLKNIYKEIESDTCNKQPDNGDLTRWATQGVLLLNSSLTVAHKAPGSHQNRGWEKFTDAVIRKVSSEQDHVAFLLWGNFARSKANLIDTSKHLVLEATHPSPFSAHKGFFGCQHFSKTNDFLRAHSLRPIIW